MRLIVAATAAAAAPTNLPHIVAAAVVAWYICIDQLLWQFVFLVVVVVVTVDQVLSSDSHGHMRQRNITHTPCCTPLLAKNFAHFCCSTLPAHWRLILGSQSTGIYEFNSFACSNNKMLFEYMAARVCVLVCVYVIYNPMCMPCTHACTCMGKLLNLYTKAAQLQLPK